VFDLTVILCRWLQMTGAMILFGSSLFFIYALPRTGPAAAAVLRWPRALLIASALTVLIACVLGLFAQTIVLAGSVQDGLQYDALSAAVTGMSFGQSSVVRAAIAALFIAGFIAVRPGRIGWAMAIFAGGVICASFAWMGHGAATKGPLGLLHLVSDIFHTLAAGVWIGALVAFLALLIAAGRRADDNLQPLHKALHGFSGIGSGLVAVLVATGLINSWFVVGVSGLPRLWVSPYGQLLTLKLILFLTMVGLAAANRFHLTPRLGAALDARSQTPYAVHALRNSLALETVISIAVLGLVAWFGTLAPPSVL
jgi:putative copper resistance protein D